MNKKYILKLEQYTISRIIEFGEKYKNENIIETSYINWNARDVIGHINCWVDYSKNKLVSIKTNKLFKDILHSLGHTRASTVATSLRSSINCHCSKS
jgi:hypothetical protein